MFITAIIVGILMFVAGRRSMRTFEVTNLTDYNIDLEINPKKRTVSIKAITPRGPEL